MWQRVTDYGRLGGDAADCAVRQEAGLWRRSLWELVSFSLDQTPVMPGMSVTAKKKSARKHVQTVRPSHCHAGHGARRGAATLRCGRAAESKAA